MMTIAFCVALLVLVFVFIIFLIQKWNMIWNMIRAFLSPKITVYVAPRDLIKVHVDKENALITFYYNTDKTDKDKLVEIKFPSYVLSREITTEKDMDSNLFQIKTSVWKKYL